MFKLRLQRVKEGLHRCIEGGRVGDDGGEVVGEDCGDDDGHGSVPAPPEERGRGAPFFFFFFLDLLPRWENGFPSGPWPPWHGRGETPPRLDLSLYLFLLLRSRLLPSHDFLYIWRSVTPIGLKPSPRFFSKN